MIWEVLNLYNDLVTDVIWKNLKYSFCFHEKLGPGEKLDPEQHYLDVLGKTKDITPWLEQHAEVVEWLKPKSEKFVLALLSVLQKKVDVIDENHIKNILEFLSLCKEKNIAGGKIDFETIFFFDEEDGQFHWNEKLLSV